jgi:hypothetical protein
MLAEHRFIRFTLAVALIVLVASVAILSVLATEARIHWILRPSNIVKADEALTGEVPYSGRMTLGRVVQLRISGQPGEYTISVHAEDPMTLDPMLIIANDDYVPLAYNDDIDGGGAREEGAFDSQVTWTAEAGETYFAYILHSDGGSEGAFTVILELATPYFIHPGW